MKVKGLWVLAVSLVLFACDKSSGLHEDSDWADELRNSSEQLEINGVEYDLEAYAVRNFNAEAYPNGSALYAGIRLEAENGELPAGLMLISISIVHEDEIWMPPILDANWISNTIEFVVQNGPRWAEGEDLDFVLQFIVPEDGRLHSIREGDVEIEAVF